MHGNGVIRLYRNGAALHHRITAFIRYCIGISLARHAPQLPGVVRQVYRHGFTAYLGVLWVAQFYGECKAIVRRSLLRVFRRIHLLGDRQVPSAGGGDADDDGAGEQVGDLGLLQVRPGLRARRLLSLGNFQLGPARVRGQGGASAALIHIFDGRTFSLIDQAHGILTLAHAASGVSAVRRCPVRFLPDIQPRLNLSQRIVAQAVIGKLGHALHQRAHTPQHAHAIVGLCGVGVHAPARLAHIEQDRVRVPVDNGLAAVGIGGMFHRLLHQNVVVGGLVLHVKMPAWHHQRAIQCNAIRLLGQRTGYRLVSTNLLDPVDDLTVTQGDRVTKISCADCLTDCFKGHTLGNVSEILSRIVHRIGHSVDGVTPLVHPLDHDLILDIGYIQVGGKNAFKRRIIHQPGVPAGDTTIQSAVCHCSAGVIIRHGIVCLGIGLFAGNHAVAVNVAGQILDGGGIRAAAIQREHIHRFIL